MSSGKSTLLNIGKTPDVYQAYYYVVFGCSVWLVSFFCPHQVLAHEPYADYLVGERSLGLAGAFVALADDPSASFHNPAGIGMLHSSAFVGSIWALSFRSRTIEDGFGVGSMSSDLSYFDVSSFPLFIAAAIKLGPVQEDGVRLHGISIAMLNPRQRENQYVAEIRDGQPDSSYPIIDRFQVRQEERTRWFGATYSYRVDKALSLGASGFFSWRSLQNEETLMNAAEVSISALDDGMTHLVNAFTDIATYDAIVRIGALTYLSPHFRLGIMFQPPGVRLGSDVTIDTLRAGVSDEQSWFDSYRADELQVNLPIPWELRCGVTWLDRPLTLLTLDMALRGPAGSEDEPMPLVEQDGQSVFAGYLLPEVNYRKLSARGSLGFEIVVAEQYPVRGGILAELSSAPSLPRESELYYREDMDLVGFSLSFGLWRQGFTLSVGTTTVWRFGRAMSLQNDFGSQDRYYAAVDASEYEIYLFISGGRRIVKQMMENISHEKPKAP